VDETTRARIEAHLWSVLRAIIGAMFALHGIDKLLGTFGTDPSSLPIQLKVGGVIELAGGVLVCVGLATRAVAFVLAGQMAVAYFQFHVFHDGFKLLPIQNGGDDTVLYCFVFLYAVVRGPGPLSLDRKLGIRLLWPA
jgi:putative oxidoreductase